MKHYLKGKYLYIIYKQNMSIIPTDISSNLKNTLGKKAVLSHGLLFYNICNIFIAYLTRVK